MKQPFIRNRVTELQAAKLLELHGFDGKSWRFERMELVGIKPPGWVQLFVFEVEMRGEHGQWVRHHGALRDDERGVPKIHVSHSEVERDRVVADWSSGMLSTAATERDVRGGNARLFVALMALLFVSAALAGLLL